MNTCNELNARTRRTIELSIVVPLFNEAENVPHFTEELVSVLTRMRVEYEVILVDDGSKDATWHEILEASNKFSNVTGIRLARNFGHQGALLAGLNAARGQAIVSMDGDMQHPPRTIVELHAAWRAGAAVVATRRTYNKKASFFKKSTSALYYRVFSYMSEVNMQPGHSDFRLLDRRALSQLLEFQQGDAFLRGIVSWLDYPTATVDFIADDRLHGESKYTLSRMLRFARNGILAFSTKPLRIGIALGLGTSALSFLYLIYIIIQYINGATVPGWASTLGLLSLLFGILFIMLGITGTYIGRIYVLLQRRPLFVVSDTTDQKSVRPGSFEVLDEI